MKKFILPSLLLLALFVFPLISADFGTNLFAYYKANNITGTTAFDELTTHNGILNLSTINLTTGIIGNGYFFNGTKGTFNTTIGSNFNNNIQPIGFSKTTSVSFWFKSFNWNGANASLNFPDFIYNGFTTIGGTTFHDTGVTGLLDGDFHHIVLVFTKSRPVSTNIGSLDVYVDGIYQTTISVQGGSGSSISATIDQTGTLIIKSTAGGSGFIAHQFGTSASNNSFNGTLDEIGFWERGLTATEIDYLYNNGTALTYPFNETAPIRKLNFVSPVIVNTSIVYNLNAYWENYANITLRYNDSIAGNVSYTQGFSNLSNESCSVGAITTCLRYFPSYNGINFYIYNNNENVTTNISINASNTFGSDTQYLIAITTFNGTTFSSGSGLFSIIVDTFTGIFPDKDSINSTTRFAYVLVVILLITATILIVGSRADNIPLALILASIVDILVFIYFIFIGYISVGLLLIMAIIGIGLAYFKIVKGT